MENNSLSFSANANGNSVSIDWFHFIYWTFINLSIVILYIDDEVNLKSLVYIKTIEWQQTEAIEKHKAITQNNQISCDFIHQIQEWNGYYSTIFCSVRLPIIYYNDQFRFLLSSKWKMQRCTRSTLCRAHVSVAVAFTAHTHTHTKNGPCVSCTMGRKRAVQHNKMWYANELDRMQW